MAKALMRRYDKNQDGSLQREEASRVSALGRVADGDDDGIVTVDELATWYRKRFKRAPADTTTPSTAGKSTSHGREPSGTSTTLVPEKGTSARTRAPDTSRQSPRTRDDLITTYAKGLMAKYDTNRDGVLQRQETSHMRLQIDDADVDKDAHLARNRDIVDGRTFSDVPRSASKTRGMGRSGRIWQGSAGIASSTQGIVGRLAAMGVTEGGCPCVTTPKVGST